MYKSGLLMLLIFVTFTSRAWACNYALPFWQSAPLWANHIFPALGWGLIIWSGYSLYRMRALPKISKKDLTLRMLLIAMGLYLVSYSTIAATTFVDPCINWNAFGEASSAP